MWARAVLLIPHVKLSKMLLGLTCGHTRWVTTGSCLKVTSTGPACRMLGAYFHASPTLGTHGTVNGFELPQTGGRKHDYKPCKR